MKRRTAFTLIEIMVVVGIIAIIAALLFPVMVEAKRRSKESVTLSNLRQCGVALTLYDVEALDPPSFEDAVESLATAPKVDALDYWITDHPEPPIPLIGSYAYVRGVVAYDSYEEFKVFKEESYATRPYPVLASIWLGTPKVRYL